MLSGICYQPAGRKCLWFSDVMLHSERSPLPVWASCFVRFSYFLRDHRFKIEDLFLSGTNTQSWSLFLFFLGHRFLYRVLYFSRPEKQFWIKKSCLLSREANLGIGPMQISCYSGLLKTRIVFHSSALCQSLHNFCAQNCKFLTAYIRSPMRQMSYFINQCLHHWLCDDRIWDWSRLDSHLMS